MKKSLTYALGMFFALALVIVPLSLMNVFAAGSADVVFLRDGSARRRFVSRIHGARGR